MEDVSQLVESLAGERVMSAAPIGSDRRWIVLLAARRCGPDSLDGIA